MNKKFSTLVASLLFTSAFSAGAQVVDPTYTGATGHETAYRTQVTQADMFDAEAYYNNMRTFNDYRVSEIKEGEWYQLEVGSPVATDVNDSKVLVQLRNYETGELYLKAVDQKYLKTYAALSQKDQNPSLNSSLWKIKVTKTTEGS